MVGDHLPSHTACSFHFFPLCVNVWQKEAELLLPELLISNVSRESSGAKLLVPTRGAAARLMHAGLCWALKLHCTLLYFVC